MKKLRFAVLVLMMCVLCLGGAMADGALTPFSVSPSPAVFYLGSNDDVVFYVSDESYDWDLTSQNEYSDYIYISFFIDGNKTPDSQSHYPEFLKNTETQLASYSISAGQSPDYSSVAGTSSVTPGCGNSKTRLTLDADWLNDHFKNENAGEYPLSVRYTNAVGEAYPLLVIATASPAPNDGSGSPGVPGPGGGNDSGSGSGNGSGSTVTVTVDVPFAAPTPAPAQVPSTGDASQVGLWAALGLLSVVTLVFSFTVLKKKRV